MQTGPSRSLPTVRMFWHGAPLRRVHRLSLASFVANGHPVVLHAYDEIAGMPSGIELADAARIIPRREVFRHARTGSLAPFSDWFRYRLLADEGGVWCDTDVVCLRPFDYPTTVILSGGLPDGLTNCVLGLPAGHPIARALAEYCEHPNRWQPYDTWSTRARKLKRRLLHGERRERVRYGETGPKALTRVAEHLGYADLALPATEFSPVSDLDWRRCFDGTLTLQSAAFAASRAVHLCFERIRRDPAFDVDARYPGSLYEELCAMYLRDASVGAARTPPDARERPRTG